jgi:hypothetical protein
MPACAFGFRALIEYRDSQVDADLTRKVVNQRVNIVRRAFRVACESERIPAEIYHGLQAVAGLKRGRTAARDTSPKSPRRSPRSRGSGPRSASRSPGPKLG